MKLMTLADWRTLQSPGPHYPMCTVCTCTWGPTTRQMWKLSLS